MTTINKNNVFTAGVFDLFHAGHMESIMKVLSMFPNRKLIIGVASDKYTKSFKRIPFQSWAERMHTIKSVFASNHLVEVIEDPLELYTDNYEKWFYDKYNITDHCQGTDFDENPKVYEYIKSINGFHVMGRSELMSTTDLINRLTPKEVIKLEGATNVNFRIGSVVIKKVLHGNPDFIDNSYKQLVEKGLFGVKTYQRYDDMVFLPFIEGNITHNLSMQEMSEVISSIHHSGLKPTMNMLDVFSFYEFYPEKNLYGSLLENMDHISHGDLAYTNVVRGQLGVFPIDWENLSYSTKYWDLGCYLASIYIYGHDNLYQIHKKLEEFMQIENADSKELVLTVMLVCDYWIQWSVHTKHDYFSKELKELRDSLATTI